MPSGSSGGKAGHTGIVISTMNSGGYTYVELDQNGKSLWLAGPMIDVKVGDSVTASQGIEMHDFNSRALRRTFPVIFFVGTLKVERSGDATEEELHPEVSVERAKSASPPERGSIPRAEDGYTLDELFDRRTDLAGKKVTVRGKVVKSSGKIMGKKWFHIQDGTGEGKNYDLVVTTDDDAASGDIVIATGTLSVDRDFGAGYRFDVILENAAIKVE